MKSAQEVKISIITVSYNQGHFIERTIKSVLSQNYPNLEFIIMDGGSSDNTVKILKRYSKNIIWRSEKDSGQSEAMNKGLRMATGQIVNFLNSDDTLEPDTLKKVAEFFKKNPKKKWLYGKSKIIDENDSEIRKPITWYKNVLLRNFSYNKLLSENFISQPTVFFKLSLINEVGYINEDEHFVADYEYWLRIGCRYTPGVSNNDFANCRMHDNSKTSDVSNSQFKDDLRIAKKFSQGAHWPIILHRINYFKIVWTYKLLDKYKKIRYAHKEVSK